MQLSTRIIREEHAALGAMLRSVLLLLDQAGRREAVPDFRALRAMLFYLDEFSERRHHQKESELLFPKLRARTPLVREVLDRLDAEHHRGELRIRNLEHLLLAYETMGESRRADFELGMRRYRDFYLEHMALEESVVLPLAERVLDAQDWAELDLAFAANRDALTGRAEPDAEYRELFTRIVGLVPAPIGLGDPY